MSDRLAWGNAGARSQEGNIVVVTSPDRKGYEVYEVDANGLESYFATIPVGQDDRIKDRVIRWAVQKHIKKYGDPMGLRAATIRLAHTKPELRPFLLPLLHEAAGKTYQQAKDAVIEYLRSEGWAIKTGLKVPYATSPDGTIRFWFKPQAVYFTNGNQHTLNGARTVSYNTDDIKKKSPKQYVDDALERARDSSI